MKTLPAVLRPGGVALEKEVIVVDDGSRDGTGNGWIRPFPPGIPYELKLVKQ